MTSGQILDNLDQYKNDIMMSVLQQCFTTLQWMKIDCIMDLWKMYSFSVHIIYKCIFAWQTSFMSEEWEFDPPIHNSKLLHKSLFFLIIYSSAGLTCFKFVKYFKIQQVQALETLYFRTIAYSYRLNHLNTGIFDWIIIRNDYRIISYIFINSM